MTLSSLVLFMFMSGDISSLLLPVVGTTLYKAECFSQPEIVVTDGSAGWGQEGGTTVDNQ